MLWSKDSVFAVKILLKYGGRAKWIFIILFASALERMLAGNPVTSLFLIALSALVALPYRMYAAKVPEASALLVAPVDGVVQLTPPDSAPAQLDEHTCAMEFTPGKRDSRVVRSPVTGEVTDSKQAGSLEFADTSGQRILLESFTAGGMPGRTRFGPVVSDEVEHGAVIGYMPVGERLRLNLPTLGGYAPMMTAGEQARGGESVAFLDREVSATNVVINNKP
jgi:hypothetical protein